METIIIVNHDKKSFFCYVKQYKNDKGYNKILLELLTPPNKSTISHWSRSDNIAFAQTYLHNYIKKTYNEIILCL